jgi:hypothetical protein
MDTEQLQGEQQSYASWQAEVLRCPRQTADPTGLGTVWSPEEASKEINAQDETWVRRRKVLSLYLIYIL